MNTTRLSFQARKFFLLVVHFLFIAAALTSIGFLYHNEHYGQGISWLKTEHYEDTVAFSNQVKKDAWRVFQYAQCRDAFETNGNVDYSRIVADVYYGPGDERSYSLNEFILYAKSHGYYLDSNWELAFEETALSGKDNETFLVDWKAYDPKYSTDDLDATQTDAAKMTMEELSKEVLTYLGAYYYVNHNFLYVPSNFYFHIVYQDVESELPSSCSNSVGLSIDELKSLGKYVYIASNLPNDITNFTQPIHSLNAIAEEAAPYDEGSYEIMLAVNTSYPYTDAYSEANATYSVIRDIYIRSLVVTAISLLVCLVTFLLLMALSGHTGRGKEIHLHKFDEIKVELFLFFCLLGTLAALALYQRIGTKLIHLLVPLSHWYYWENILRLLVYYMAAFFAGFGLLRRYKAKTLAQNSMTSDCIHAFRLSMSRKTFTLLLLAGSFGYLLLNSFLLGSTLYLFWFFSGQGIRWFCIPLFLLWFGFNAFVLYRLLTQAMQNDKLNAALQHLSAGETSYKVASEEFSGKQKELAQTINNISTGLEAALQEKVRSERLKADLITNVSHDIKTPLTSIINYVDLIKREHISDPKILGYLDILEQKSQRLKNLTEDLVEASKASSGNVKLDIMDIDLVELVQQTTGEFEEKFASRNLSLVMGLPKHSLFISADGRRMWRILENLYNNAFKYAMEQSRVYVDVFAEGEFVYFTIKNTSSYPLNIRPDELTERFVRGDVSRSTEGSGLGLSIARSLTELQNGRFTIYIDGDLFKAELRFPIKNMPA
ncbi:MAG: HAMP domain-containing sensor histidine kinase [bacterium]|nr:HAMP domain-containing sensor histidine kinase [bacterium]